MATTIKVKVDNDDAKKGIKEIGDEFEELDRLVDNANDELKEQEKLFDDNRKAAEHFGRSSSKAMGSGGGGRRGGGGGSGLIGKIGIAVGAAWALHEAFKAAQDMAMEMAENGDRSMQKVADAVNQAADAKRALFTEGLKVGRSIRNINENTAILLDQANALLQWTDRSSVALARDIKQRERILELIRRQSDIEKANAAINVMTLGELEDNIKKNMDILESKERQGLNAVELNQLFEETNSLLVKQKELQLEIGTAEDKRIARRRRERDAMYDLRLRLDMDAYQREREANEEAIKGWREQREAAKELFEKRKFWADHQKQVDKEVAMQRWRQERAEHNRRKQRIDDLVQKQLEARERLKQALSGTGENSGASKIINNASQLKALYERIVKTRVDKAIRDAERASDSGTISDTERSKIKRTVTGQTKRDFSNMQGGPRRGQSGAQFAKFQQDFQEELKRATAQNAAETINTLAKTGDISREQAVALGKASGELLKQQDELKTVERQVDRINQVLDELTSSRSHRAAAGGRRG